MHALIGHAAMAKSNVSQGATIKQLPPALPLTRGNFDFPLIYNFTFKVAP